MKTLYITQHVLDQLENRPFLSQDTFVKLVHKVIVPLVQDYTHLTDGYNGQLAIRLGTLRNPVNIGKSRGDCVIIAVNMARGTIPTIFARFEKQGKPKSAAIMIDLEGNILDQ